MYVIFLTTFTKQMFWNWYTLDTNGCLLTTNRKKQWTNLDQTDKAMREMLENICWSHLLFVDPFCPNLNRKSRPLNPTIKVSISQVESNIQQLGIFKQTSCDLCYRLIPWRPPAKLKTQEKWGSTNPTAALSATNIQTINRFMFPMTFTQSIQRFNHQSSQIKSIRFFSFLRKTDIGSSELSV